VEALSSTVTKSIVTDYGELVLNGYTHNANGTITIDYEYTLTSAPENTAAGDGSDADIFTDDSISITAKDRDGDDDQQDLVIRIMDDVPTAQDDANQVTEGDGIDDVSTTTGNVIGAGGTTEPSGGDVADTTGADGATVAQIQFGTESKDVPESGTVSIDGQYGTLTIQPDGSYSYTLDNSNLDVQGLIDTETLTDTFSYTITDG